MKFKFLIVLLSLFSQVALADVSRDMLEQFLASTSSMKARFQQQLVDSKGFLLQESAGVFILKRPGKFQWDYTLPYPQQIVSNGKKIWVYDSELEQVSIRKYDQVLAGSPVVLLDQRKKLDADFNVNELGLVQGEYWVVLTPRSAENEFKQIEVGMRNRVLHTMKLKDNFEQTTIIVFDTMELNPELDDKLFEFVIPEGTDVVGG
ncbi:MAG: outer membrane lipoprotein chaperone LolA [Gammaproteobacteria bacterium]|nr:MAG: outer membrane lipoprotein chaperone LolA [Gammaproteobacteria bacterium]